jgi:hypothetical protein
VVNRDDFRNLNLLTSSTLETHCVSVQYELNFKSLYSVNVGFEVLVTGSNTSTVALRVGGGKEAGTQCLGV